MTNGLFLSLFLASAVHERAVHPHEPDGCFLECAEGTECRRYGSVTGEYIGCYYPCVANRDCPGAQVCVCTPASDGACINVSDSPPGACISDELEDSISPYELLDQLHSFRNRILIGGVLGKPIASDDGRQVWDLGISGHHIVVEHKGSEVLYTFLDQRPAVNVGRARKAFAEGLKRLKKGLAADQVVELLGRPGWIKTLKSKSGSLSVLFWQIGEECAVDNAQFVAGRLYDWSIGSACGAEKTTPEKFASPCKGRCWERAP